MSGLFLRTLLLARIAATDALSLPHTPIRSSMIRCAAAAADDDITTEAELLKSSGWASLQTELDELPAFTCVDADGAPLGYEREGQPIAIFFSDVDRAKQELEMATSKFPQLKLRIMGVGLGDVHRRRARGEAMLVPSIEAIEGAGDDFSDGERLPLYTCLRMSSMHPDGSKRTPLFMDPRDAQASLDKALEAAAGSAAGGALTPEQQAQLTLVCTSMDQAVAMVLSGEEKQACEAGRFSFVAPRKSLQFLREQQEARGGGPPPGAATRAAVAEARASGSGKKAAASDDDARSMLFPD